MSLRKIKVKPCFLCGELQSRGIKYCKGCSSEAGKLLQRTFAYKYLPRTPVIGTYAKRRKLKNKSE